MSRREMLVWLACIGGGAAALFGLLVLLKRHLDSLESIYR